MPAAQQNEPLLLTGGFYQARSLIANAQRCVNLYPERNPEDAEVPFTQYLTPGLSALRRSGASDGPAEGVFRGLYTASSGVLFGVVGQWLYVIDADWRFFAVAELVTVATTPVSMSDNGDVLELVDGSQTLYVVDLTTYAVSTLGNGDNFYGADKVDYIDTFFVYNLPNSQAFYCSLSNSTTIDPLDIAEKTGLPDRLQTLICIHREIWLLGAQLSTEVWYNSGGSLFPFSIVAGVFLEQACVAKYSVAKHDLLTFWLGIDKDGLLTVFMGQNYKAVPISTKAIAAAMSAYTVVSDAIGMVYKQQDHVFYVLTFPTEDKTWVFDLSEGLWHERTWTDSDGVEHRIRANCMALAYGKVVCGDWENGTLYELSLTTYEDEVVEGTPSPIVRRRGFPHIINKGKRITHQFVTLDAQCGEATVDLVDEDVTIYLRYSDDRGKTWGNPVPQSLGLAGEYILMPKWSQLGMARDRVYEVFWSGAFNTALNGLWLDASGALT